MFSEWDVYRSEFPLLTVLCPDVVNDTYHSCTKSKEFAIICDQDPLMNPYIEKMYLNGNELNRFYVTYAEITAGGTLEFNLSIEPKAINNISVPVNIDMR